jgi:DNA-binding transcriptional MerR regulator
MAILAKRSGVPTPTIKHYIREGLLPGPEVRTSRNMAYYDARVVARIQSIKSLQAQQFLPLRMIGELLEPAPSAALRSDKASQRRTLTNLAPALATDRSEKRRRQSDLTETEGVTRRELAQLEKAGVIELRGEGESAGYSGPDVDIVELVGEMRRRGLGDIFPISIADAYRDAVERLVTFEIEVFSRHALGATLPAPLPEVAKDAVNFGARLVVALRSRMLPKLLERLGALVPAAVAPKAPKPKASRKR